MFEKRKTDGLFISGIVRGLQHSGLVLKSLELIEDGGESHFEDGENVDGPEGCECCHDDFDKFNYGDRRGYVEAVWHKLILDARDPTDPDTSEPEVRALCTWCYKELKHECVALGLVDYQQILDDIRREITARIFEVVEHGILMDKSIARSYARSLKRKGFVGVRVVPRDGGGFHVRSNGKTVEGGV